MVAQIRSNLSKAFMVSLLIALITGAYIWGLRAGAYPQSPVSTSSGPELELLPKSVSRYITIIREIYVKDHINCKIGDNTLCGEFMALIRIKSGAAGKLVWKVEVLFGQWPWWCNYSQIRDTGYIYLRAEKPSEH